MSTGATRGGRRLGVAATVAIALLLTSCAGSRTEVDSPVGGTGFRAGDGTATLLPVDDRRAAPALRGSTLDGAPLDVADLRGTVVVLNIWGSWCAPCKKEQPDLQRAAADLAPAGVRFVGINVRDRTTGNALAHNRRFGVTYPSLFDPSAGLVGRFRDLPPTAIPSTVILDRDGRVAARVIGGTTYDDLVALVRRVA
ncbi:MAG TPA: TlpA disulfide reductase family protein [Mycobacteriales bacterium]|nr:TlpA disulfide reductase family protein [Mycobacteriales bacterium]